MVKIKEVMQKTNVNLQKQTSKTEDHEMMEEDKQKITVFVVKLKTTASGLGQAYKVILPPGFGLNFWRRFVYSGCKPIAEREELKLMLEC